MLWIVPALALLAALANAQQDFCSRLQDYHSNTALASSINGDDAFTGAVAQFAEKEAARIRENLDQLLCNEDVCPAILKTLSKKSSDPLDSYDSSILMSSYSHLSDASIKATINAQKNLYVTRIQDQQLWDDAVSNLLNPNEVSGSRLLQVLVCSSQNQCQFLMFFVHSYPRFGNSDMLLLKRSINIQVNSTREEVNPEFLSARFSFVYEDGSISEPLAFSSAEADFASVAEVATELLDYSSCKFLKRSLTAFHHLDFLKSARGYAELVRDPGNFWSTNPLFYNSYSSNGNNADSSNKTAPAQPDMHPGKSKKVSYLDQILENLTVSQLGGCSADIAAGAAVGGPIGAGVGATICAFPEFVKAFKSSHESRLIGEIENKGWTHFTRVQAGPNYVEMLPIRAKDIFGKEVFPVAQTLCSFYRNHFADLPAAERGDILQYMWNAANGFGNGKQILLGQSIHYTTESGGDAKSIKFLTNHDPELQATSVMFYMNVWSDIKLAPRLLLYRDSTSVLGGLWSNTKDEIRELPRSITEDDIDALFLHADALAAKSMAFVIGLCQSLGDCQPTSFAAVL